MEWPGVAWLGEVPRGMAGQGLQLHHSSVAQWLSTPLLTGRLLVRIQPEERESWLGIAGLGRGKDRPGMLVAMARRATVWPG